MLSSRHTIAPFFCSEITSDVSFSLNLDAEPTVPSLNTRFSDNQHEKSKTGILEASPSFWTAVREKKTVHQNYHLGNRLSPEKSRVTTPEAFHPGGARIAATGGIKMPRRSRPLFWGWLRLEVYRMTNSRGMTVQEVQLYLQRSRVSLHIEF